MPLLRDLNFVLKHMVSHELIILLKDYSGGSVEDEWERTETGGRKKK